MKHAAEKVQALLRLFGSHGNFLAPLDSGGVEPARARRVGAVVPLTPTANAGTDKRGLADGRLVAAHEIPFGIDALDPVDIFGDGPGGNEFPVGAVDDESIAALIHGEQQLARNAIHGRVNKHALEGGVEIPDIVRDLLVIPLELAGIGIERDDAVGVEVGAFAGIAIEISRGIADAPIEQIQLGIIRAGEPGGASARFPAIAGPGLVAFLARGGNGPETPGAAAGVDVESREIAAMSGIAAGDADHHFVFDEQRRAGDVAAALAHVLDVDSPELAAGFLVERHDIIIERAKEHAAGADGHAARPGAVDNADLARVLVEVVPDFPAGFRVDGEDTVPGRRDVHHAVH